MKFLFTRTVTRVGLIGWFRFIQTTMATEFGCGLDFGFRFGWGLSEEAIDFFQGETKHLVVFFASETIEVHGAYLADFHD